MKKNIIALLFLTAVGNVLCMESTSTENNKKNYEASLKKEDACHNIKTLFPQSPTRFISYLKSNTFNDALKLMSPEEQAELKKTAHGIFKQEENKFLQQYSPREDLIFMQNAMTTFALLLTGFTLYDNKWNGSKIQANLAPSKDLPLYANLIGHILNDSTLIAIGLVATGLLINIPNFSTTKTKNSAKEELNNNHKKFYALDKQLGKKAKA